MMIMCFEGGYRALTSQVRCLQEGCLPIRIGDVKHARH
jgi:hypothetical protein